MSTSLQALPNQDGGVSDLAVRRAQAPAPCKQVKLLTLVIVESDGRVLLGMKKRGFGEGYYNGFGGKVEDGETIEEAAIRELEEEAGITAQQLIKRGVLTFHFDDKPCPWEVHVFHVAHFTGEPHETDEMSPIWFSYMDIPFGMFFQGEFYFQDTHELVSHSLKIVQCL
eukprot:c15866_g1_i2 orf=186-692(+)